MSVLSTSNPAYDASLLENRADLRSTNIMRTHFQSNGSASKPKAGILHELEQLKVDRNLQLQTTHGRYLQCRDLQAASALLAKAVEQCSRWRGGKRVPAPGGVLPPAS